MIRRDEKPPQPLPIGEGVDKILRRQKEPAAPGLDLARKNAFRILEADLAPLLSFARVGLENLDLYDDKQKQVVNRFRNMIGQMPTPLVFTEPAGLIFIGSTGTGKDHLLARALYAAVERGASARWIHWPRLSGMFNDGITLKRTQAELIREWAVPDVLGISDLLPARSDLSAWDVKCLMLLIDTRLRLLRPTWVNVNAVNVAEVDARLSPPLFDRLRDGAQIFHCFWQSYRERRKPFLSAGKSA